MMVGARAARMLSKGWERERRRRRGGWDSGALLQRLQYFFLMRFM